MVPHAAPEPLVFPPDPDPRRALLIRVASGQTFLKSNRLRELLLFIGDHCLTPGQADLPLREQDIGVSVFGRPPGYDTSQDTLVRVQASQLRKKLQQYFETEGRDEAVLIELPKGSYTLQFPPRPVAAAAEAESASAGDHPVAMATHEAADIIPVPAASQRRMFAAVCALAIVALAAALYLFVQNGQLRRRAEFSMGARPAVDRLWRQIFDNGQHSYLVVADGNLVIFEDTIKQQISLSDYQNREFRRLAEARIERPDIRALALNVVGRNNTSMADAAVLRRMSLLFAANALPIDVINARETTINQVTSHNNVILMGSRRANPWVQLYEDKLNFQTVFEESPKVAYFINRAPRGGEAAEYRGKWSKVGYCRVAFLPASKGAGKVVLVSGTDIQSTEAGGEFLTSEDSIRKLRQAFGLTPDGSEPVPYFEVLLETGLLNMSVARFDVVALRKNETPVAPASPKL